MSKPSFLIIDSGVGGLSILQEIQHLIPDATACYVADNGAYPYGTLEESTLVARLLTLLPLLQQRIQPDIIIIACNTASTVVLDPLRAQTRTPVIGVVPAIKPAARLTRTGHIGLLATPGTIKRRYTDQLISDFASNCTVTKVGSSDLVQEAERKMRGLSVRRDVLTSTLTPFSPPFLSQPHLREIDVIVLGCTHFPFLKEELAAHLSPGVMLIDSGEAIAKRTQQILGELPTFNGQTSQNLFLFTAENPEAHILEPGIAAFGFEKVHFIGQTP